MMAVCSYCKVALIGLLFFSQPVFATTTVVYRSPESEGDVRYQYDLELLELALQTTKLTDGDYKLIPSANMNFSRAKAILNKDEIENFIVKLSFEPAYNTHFAYAPFPVDLGIVGYRVCFTSHKLLEDLKKVRTKTDLLKYSQGVGHGWSDGKILQDNGFEIVSISRYENLFRMVAANRFDLFCRGINEVLEEFNSHLDLDGFDLEQSFAIYYPLPRFYYGHKNSAPLLERIERGLKIAYQNGTLQELWKKHYQESIEFVKLDQRYLFKLENKFAQDLDPSYKQYIYHAQLKQQ
ncbi:hypothetical protein DBZ36_09850 [Alginatibacterium sediminis]|uniref:Solute-binding protein family 3/N-terminal domain-containing protein n=1 Tax=Alginatibacterium sediminis TaxID=2164068 RepID=A0A420EDG7_9ALTE|nr:hypothetical protein [Alginatibacterium sediminis]RKF18694.1 hypothetical protein DBZ36_09850 [Alginatibacterium sediminis]